MKNRKCYNDDMNDCNIFCECSKYTMLFVGCIIFPIFITTMAIGHNEYISYDEHMCNITRIERPLEVYSSNYTHQWNGCRCYSLNGGHFNISQGVYGCLNFYPNFDEEKMIKPYYNTQRGKNNKCTKKQIVPVIIFLNYSMILTIFTIIIFFYFFI